MTLGKYVSDEVDSLELDMWDIDRKLVMCDQKRRSSVESRFNPTLVTVCQGNGISFGQQNPLEIGI